jgi:hypothetical protein
LKVRPIIFTGESVRAILAGSKVQTRRIMKPQPPEWVREFGQTAFTPPGHISGRGEYEDQGPGEKFFKCPYGVPGDRLWMREAWLGLHRDHWAHPNQSKESVVNERGDRNAVAYRADTTPEGEEIRRQYGYRWRPSIHMPRWASRITLEVTEVRVQRLQEISGEDAQAEGISPLAASEISSELLRAFPSMRRGASEREERMLAAFGYQWDRLNAKRAPWPSNPWVWGITFRRIKP